jgi:hypothetical protein
MIVNHVSPAAMHDAVLKGLSCIALGAEADEFWQHFPRPWDAATGWNMQINLDLENSPVAESPRLGKVKNTYNLEDCASRLSLHPCYKEQRNG